MSLVIKVIHVESVITQDFAIINYNM